MGISTTCTKWGNQCSTYLHLIQVTQTCLMQAFPMPQTFKIVGFDQEMSHLVSNYVSQRVVSFQVSGLELRCNSHKKSNQRLFPSLNGHISLLIFAHYWAQIWCLLYEHIVHSHWRTCHLGFQLIITTTKPYTTHVQVSNKGGTQLVALPTILQAYLTSNLLEIMPSWPTKTKGVLQNEINLFICIVMPR